MSAQPYDFGQAYDADRNAEATQRAAEKFIVDCATTYANAESAYRQALAEKILALKADGMAWTTCSDVARGDVRVAALKVKRDIAEGMQEAAIQAAWRASKSRDSENRRIEWSMRRDLAEGYRPPEVPADAVTYGARRAA